MRFPPVVAALTAALALAGAAAAQSPSNATDALTPGRRAFAFSAHSLKDGGQTALGLWRVAAPDRSRGLLLNISAQASHIGAQAGFPAHDQSQVSVTLGPRTRRYLATGAALLPFVESGLDLGVLYSSFEGPGTPSSQRTWSPSLGATVGAGAEWFALRRLSVAGQAGLHGSVSYMHSSQSGGVTPSSSNGWGVSLSTFVSALTVQVYF